MPDLSELRNNYLTINVTAVCNYEMVITFDTLAVVIY